jgi:hypothetical protein
MFPPLESLNQSLRKKYTNFGFKKNQFYLDFLFFSPGERVVTFFLTATGRGTKFQRRVQLRFQHYLQSWKFLQSPLNGPEKEKKKKEAQKKNRNKFLFLSSLLPPPFFFGF